MGPAGLVALLVVRYRVLFRGATVRRHFMGLQRPPLHSTWVTGFFFSFSFGYRVFTRHTKESTDRWVDSARDREREGKTSAKKDTAKKITTKR